MILKELLDMNRLDALVDFAYLVLVSELQLPEPCRLQSDSRSIVLFKLEIARK